MRIRQLQKPKTRSIRCGGSNGSARGLPTPTEGPSSFSCAPLSSTSCLPLPEWVPELAVQRASSHRQKPPPAQPHPVGARQFSLAQSQAPQGGAGSCQQTPLGTLSPRVRPCPLDTRCAPHLPPPLQRAEPVPHSWGEVCSPLSNLVSPRPKGSASCHRGATEVHQPADRHDSAGEERTDCSKYHASPMCQEPSWTSDRHYLTESSQEHCEAGPSSPARWGGH